MVDNIYGYKLIWLIRFIRLEKDRKERNNKGKTVEFWLITDNSQNEKKITVQTGCKYRMSCESVFYQICIKIRPRIYIIFPQLWFCYIHYHLFLLIILSFTSMIADPDGVDPDPKCTKKHNPDPTLDITPKSDPT